MSNRLKNKRILFFSPVFFGYEEKIKTKMESLGAIVDAFDERSVQKSYQKALLKVNPNIFKNKTEKYYFNILEKIKMNQYDYILFIKCDMPSTYVLKEYKKTFATARLCLYMWDSLKNIPNIKVKLQYFDHITSFDRKDCLENQNIIFRPLFYFDDYKTDISFKREYKYDVSFIGTIHSDRYKILKAISKQAKKEELNIYIFPFLQSRFIYYLYKLLKKEFRSTSINDFKFKGISSKEIASIVAQSRIIIDIEHPKQTGLTMRTIEMLGMKKQIITTNIDIVNYDFYDSRNFFVLDRNNLSFSFKAISNEYFDIDESIYEKYSIENWIHEVLGECL